MSFLLIAAIGQTIFKLLLAVMAIFLILLVLVQRGRGGGLAGALGGMGGSSAFGAKAGDVFTRITIVAAALWIILCILATKMAPSSESRINTGLSAPMAPPADGAAPAADTASQPKEGESAAGETTSDADAPASEAAQSDSPGADDKAP